MCVEGDGRKKEGISSLGVAGWGAHRRALGNRGRQRQTEADRGRQRQIEGEEGERGREREIEGDCSLRVQSRTLGANAISQHVDEPRESPPALRHRLLKHGAR